MRVTRPPRGPTASSTAEAMTRGHRQRAGLAHALEAERVQRRERLEVVDDACGGTSVARGQRVVHVAAGQRLARLVVADLLEERAADAERDRALDLALDDHRVDQPAAVVARSSSRAAARAPDADRPRPARRGRRSSTSMSGGWKKCVASSPGSTPCAAVAIAGRRRRARPSSTRCSGGARVARSSSPCLLDLVLRDAERARGQAQGLGAQLARGERDGGAAHDGGAAGERARRPARCPRCRRPRRVTSAGVTPSSSAAIWASVVSSPWPCEVTPVNTVTRPAASTRTVAPSNGPTPVSST